MNEGKNSGAEAFPFTLLKGSTFSNDTKLL